MPRRNDDDRTRPGRNKKKKPPVAPFYVGAQIEGPIPNYFQWTGTNSLIGGRLLWSEIEKQPNVYDFSTAISHKEALLPSQRLIWSFKASPAWYRENPDIICSLKSDKSTMNSVTQFIAAAIVATRPWAIEVWNEPDVSAEHAKAANLDGILGGFGIEKTKEYAALVNAVSDGARMAEKVYGHRTLVIAGAMLFDYSLGKEFWRRVRKYRPRYGAVSFHAYSNFASWKTGMENVSRKAQAIRSLGETAPLVLSETALIYPPNGQRTDQFNSSQAAYFSEILKRCRAIKVGGVMWYSLCQNGDWAGSSLVYKGQKFPAHEVYLSATN